jgi:hypothetical protein
MHPSSRTRHPIDGVTGLRTFGPMRRWLATLCGLLLAGCSGGAPAARTTATSRAPVPFVVGATVTGELGGQRVRLDEPLTRRLAGVAVYFHGRGGSVNSKMGEPWLNSIRVKGWAVASGDLHGDAWGDPAAVRDATALVSWAEATTGGEARLLIGVSMGGSVSLNALLDGAVEARCWFGSEPVVDLDAVRAVPHADAEIAALYGGRPPASSNPADRLDQLPLDTRYRVVASGADHLVPPTAHADRLIAALRVRGGDVSSVAATGGHSDASHFRPEDLRAFAEGCS